MSRFSNFTLLQWCPLPLWVYVSWIATHVSKETGKEVRGGTDDKSKRLVSDTKIAAMIGNLEFLLCQSTYLSDIILCTQLHNCRAEMWDIIVVYVWNLECGTGIGIWNLYTLAYRSLETVWMRRITIFIHGLSNDFLLTE